MPTQVTAPTEPLRGELADFMLVKNTFIDFRDPLDTHGAHKRSHSAPIIRRLEGSLESDSNQQSPSAAIPRWCCHFYKTDSQASTDACSERSNDKFDCSSEDIPITPLSTPRSQVSLPSTFGLQSEDTSAKHSAFSVVPPPPSVPWHSFPVESLAGCCKARPGFTSLNPKAVPWQPTPVLPVPDLPEDIPITDFAEAIAAMVKNFSQEVERIVSVPITTHIIREQRTWSIICRIREEDIEHQDTILLYAKSHILCAAEASDAFHLLGCHSDPFRPKQRGFGAVLASMQDRSLACWDFYRSRRTLSGNSGRGQSSAGSARKTW
eukprot:CAMPEP_0172929570 /NCGR_PEP_ID=MMETSP1075-20121228/218549_1 /TAXON_ID=2916 /ORGANISM="Ceratium fusus, Strain PA161109" /LENGTH=321 /DNA_ID=CAMNT_0013790865 /DNA_START=44 /DNA_END=1006 /DNA_ORIENTATION=+